MKEKYFYIFFKNHFGFVFKIQCIMSVYNRLMLKVTDDFTLPKICVTLPFLSKQQSYHKFGKI